MTPWMFIRGFFWVVKAHFGPDLKVANILLISDRSHTNHLNKTRGYMLYKYDRSFLAALLP
ncbi:hypothetical protein LX64_01739 [Chitinophaga skermanii]|uniref:Uncharacterized protein n=1 Tax=Chitinophaga skermanii TaxID=331697 RepID=A0A327QSD8_9BACT|nr:hypothetical protein LX64_01739 [Chitinophaga skermanii]